MYDVNKIQNSILKVPWFHTPASFFPRNAHDTMDDVVKQKLATVNSLRVFGDNYFPICNRAVERLPEGVIHTSRLTSEVVWEILYSRYTVWPFFFIDYAYVRVHV